MPRARNPNRDRAKEIYLEYEKNGENITNREIAKLLGEDEKVIAVWKKRDNWGNVVQQSKESCTTKKQSGKKGNQNAKGHGAPKGNQNHFIHGAYANPCFDTIPENVMERLNAMDFENEETVLVDKLKLLTYRESQLMKSIQTFENKQNGITLDSVTKRTVETVKDEPKRGVIKQTETITKTKDVFDVLGSLNTELTRVQNLKLKCITSLHKLRTDKNLQLSQQAQEEDVSKVGLILSGNDDELQGLYSKLFQGYNQLNNEEIDKRRNKT